MILLHFQELILIKKKWAFFSSEFKYALCFFFQVNVYPKLTSCNQFQYENWDVFNQKQRYCFAIEERISITIHIYNFQNNFLNNHDAFLAMKQDSEFVHYIIVAHICGASKSINYEQITCFERIHYTFQARAKGSIWIIKNNTLDFVSIYELASTFNWKHRYFVVM